MNLLILGASSYLGLRLLENLKEDTSYSVYCFIRSEESQKKIESITSRVHFIDSVEQCRLNFDVIINFIVDYGKNKDLEDLRKINIDYPFNIINSIEFETIINTSTALPKHVSAYSQTKNELEEKLVLSFKNKRVINLKLQQFYGPGTTTQNFITFLIDKMKTNQSIDLSPCLNSRDFIFVDDVISAIKIIIEKRNEIKTTNIDLGTGETLLLKNVVEEIKNKTSSHSTLNFGALPARKNEPLIMKADITFLKTLGWQPKTDFNDGINKILKTTI